MQQVLLLVCLALLFLIPFVSADLITPGHHYIDVNNVITNINNFPDSVFISACPDSGPGIGTCPVKIIASDGIIPGYYKFCQVFVYAIKKSDFNDKDLIRDTSNMNETEKEDYSLYLDSYLNSSKATKVISKVHVSAEVPDSSTEQVRTNQYNISMNITKVAPDNKLTQRDSKAYLYWILPIVALVIILLILFLRRKGESNAS
jgi:hypothetical protein